MSKKKDASVRPLPADGLLQSALCATDAGELVVVEDVLHDEAFDLSEVHFNEEAHTVAIPVRRRFHSGAERVIKAGILFKTYEKDWMRSVLTIRRVHSWEALYDPGIDSYTFNRLRYVKGFLKVACNEALVLKFAVEDLDVELADVGFEGKARFRRGLLGIEILNNTEVYE